MRAHDGAASLAALAPSIEFDRDHAAQLLLMGVQQLHQDGHLPTFALVDARGEVQEMRWAKSLEQRKRSRVDLERKADQAQSVRLVCCPDLSQADANRFSDEAVVEALHLMSALTNRTLLRDAIDELLLGLLHAVLPSVAEILAKREGLSHP